MRGKVTKRAVDAIKPDPSSDVFLWDSKLSGFGVRVKPSGVRSFVVSYYAPGLHRKRRRLTLGTYGPLTVDEARTRAERELGRVTEGTDPARERVDARRAAEEETVERLFAAYLEHGRARFKPRTAELFESIGRLHIIPALGKLPVASVSVRDVARLHYGLRDTPATANRAVQLVKALFYWLERQELFTGKNPARNVELFAEQGRERFLSVEEMARLGQALRAAETVGLPPAPKHKKKPSTKRPRNAGMFASELQPASPVAVAALRFLIFTGWREQEALTLRWDAVNPAAGTATLADTKTGKSDRVLNAPACAIIDAQPHVEGSAYVFPGRDPVHPLREIQRLWYAARIAAQLEGVRLHDLRHSMASFAGGRGYSLFLIGKLLGHRDQRSAARYAHLADDIRKTMADDVGEVIREAMASDPGATRSGKPATALSARR